MRPIRVYPDARAALLLTGCILLAACDRAQEVLPVPQVPRKADASAELQAGRPDARVLLDWARDELPIMRVETSRDTLPNGLATAMTPILVDWERSRQEGDKEDNYVVHNVVIGGNPVDGRLLLGSVRIPAHGVESVEWNNVVVRAGGRDTPGGHGQIRFVFSPDSQPEILGLKGTPMKGSASIDDLILSWEAWRPPATRWDGRKGLDPENYALTVRGYVGAERFLMDTLRNCAWECYPLKLPEAPGAAHDILRTCLVMGDGLARRTARAMSDSLIETWGPVPEGYEEEAQRLHSLLSPDTMPDDPLAHLMGEADLSYHLLLRSCITQALTAIDLGVRATYWRKGDKEALKQPRLQVAPDNIPPWMDQMAHASRREILAKVPAAAYWVAKNQHVIPANAYRLLQDGELLQMKDGQPVKYYYRADQMTPYGSVVDNIMY